MATAEVRRTDLYKEPGPISRLATGAKDMGTVNQASEDRLAALRELVALHSVEGVADLLGVESTAVTDELRLDRAIE